MSKTMIITGASRGIGAAIAREAWARGFNLVLNARSGNALNSLAKSLDVSAKRVAAVAGDVSEKEVCNRIVDTALERFGGVDVLVNNAGILEPVGPLHAVDANEWVQNLMVNVAGPVLLTRCALVSLRQRHGCVINISSGAAVKAVRGWSAYCTSKAALNHFNRMLCAEYPEIVAIAVSPGMTATDMQATIREQGEGRMPKDEYRRFVDAHRKGELRSPGDVARAIVALGRYAPQELSGKFVTVEDPRVEALLKAVAS
ncbi:MAG: SDR family NAD(P)-dependent oxidoreductase [Gammaproteobacteria bacterium]|nr:SDR family NAD(P)-dependent oxidoreductase [Gammaproteobacteria bacterium]MDH3410992.1 SDR family NAD(P)-dependent oxidoreductase [Gammaproteobacteria bacterium]